MATVKGKQGISERILYPTTEVINLILSVAVTDRKLSFQQVKHLGTKQRFVSHNRAGNPEKLSVRKTARLYIRFHLLSRIITRVVSQNNIKDSTCICVGKSTNYYTVSPSFSLFIRRFTLTRLVKLHNFLTHCGPGI
jgi:hypothetical protein